MSWSRHPGTEVPHLTMRAIYARPMSGLGADRFTQAAAQVRALRLRPELDLAEAPAPRRMAPQTLALTADVLVAEDELGTGRLVVLHDPAGQEAWDGNTRLVLYLDALVEPELAADPLLPEVGWAWLEESLESCGAQFWALGGTVTRVQSESFGALQERGAEGRVQVRASWTAGDVADLPAHVMAWADVLSAACGLEPLPDGVAVLMRRGG